jgi:adenylate kinase family enzyme
VRRVVVLGGPGAGKSIFARSLGERIGAPVLHLDRRFFAPGRALRPEAAFLASAGRSRA